MFTLWKYHFFCIHLHMITWWVKRITYGVTDTLNLPQTWGELWKFLTRWTAFLLQAVYALGKNVLNDPKAFQDRASPSLLCWKRCSTHLGGSNPQQNSFPFTDGYFVARSRMFCLRIYDVLLHVSYCPQMWLVFSHLI